MKFIVKTNPIAKARHRTKVIRGRVIAYDPQHAIKLKIQLEIKKLMKENSFNIIENDPINMTLTNFVEIPKSLSQNKRNELEGKYCDKRPDLDNYFKFWADVLNEVAYKDDKQIVSMSSEKIYSSNPRVEIILNKIGSV